MTNNIKIAHLQTKEEQFKAAFGEVINMIPHITQLHRSLFDGMIKEGYTEVQSFDFATQYILQIIGGNNNGNSK